MILKIILTTTFLSTCIFSSISQANKNTTKDADIKKRKEMIVMARQLGVTCTYCHDTKNFKSHKLKTYKISLNHINLVHSLNKIGIKSNKKRSKVKADCFMCHRGTPVPNYVEVVPSELLSK